MKRTYWLKDKVLATQTILINKDVIITRNYHKDRVTIDYINGRLVTYKYDGTWIAG